MLALCPDPLPYSPSVDRSTVDGVTYSVESIDQAGLWVLASYNDNRTEVGDLFRSVGGVSMGHVEIFETHSVAFRMSVEFDREPVSVLDYRAGLPGHEYEICVEGASVVFFASADIFGPAHQTWVWDFAVFFDRSPDLNGDGRVDGADLSIMLGDWGLTESPADLDGDGVVAADDLAMLLSHWS